MRVAYRVRQFWQAFVAAPHAEQLRDVGKLLPAALYMLFCRMPPSEQTHALEVYQRLRRRAVHDPELLQAALLHDVGKALHPLKLWERVVVVLAQGVAPGVVKRWGKASPQGWRRAFAVAVQHASWGAELAAQAGASAAVVYLIRNHHAIEMPPTGEHLRVSPELLERWLYLLKAADNGY